MKYIKYLSLIEALCFIVIAVLFASCEKEDTSVIDPRLTFPKILGVLITPSVYDTSDINGIAWAEVTSEEPVTSVTVTVKNPLNTEIGIFTLRDDGVAPDITSGDGRYTGIITFSMTCRIVGQYKGEFLAKNVSGLNSSLVSQNFSVINSHSLPPSLSNLIAPDSLQRPSTGESVVFLRITASDPDGLCDIDYVFFNSFKPDGVPSSGNPFGLYDDGDTLGHCDAVPGDGNYSLCIRIASTNQLGTYTFKYNARDRSGILSDTLFHTIYVY